MKESEHYKGREHSGIKHFLLESYLEILFMIIGQHERRICYIDCFSGPWQESGQNLEGTSIALSLKVMAKCRNNLKKHGKSVEFRALFIEKGKGSYKKLDTYLKNTQLDGITTKAKNGEFHDLRSEILYWCGPRDFAFFFIDPKGWKNAIEIPTLTPLLQRPRSEYLINFMYDFLLRTHTQEAFQEDMEKIFGEVPDTSGMSPRVREDYLIQLYRDSLKSIPAHNTGRLRSAYVSILDRVKERTKYHLVYLTHHPLGIVKFMTASEKMERVQKHVRAKTKQESRIETSGQNELFAAEIDPVTSDDIIDIEVVKDYWLEKLSESPRKFRIEDLSDMLEETNWFESNLQQAFKELAKEGKVTNIDAPFPNRRSKRPVHFEDNELLQRTQP
ncbi:MAG: three-Cys-motif partner protein TcmP [Candidatus Thiodiazotropha sp. (ex Lucinoma borealis)]|nr:three-Cys-motif partner protein TcmP [Candidatus Thiodiazotropha sp. (ex Lucinoma borealis)]MCU7869336.1 three-Cys-motif partner protein TcmP [Candidatus Thiodiazotropha sp. (ex Lucinoma borealis)]